MPFLTMKERWNGQAASHQAFFHISSHQRHGETLAKTRPDHRPSLKEATCFVGMLDQ